jgi:hypothetical protein
MFAVLRSLVESLQVLLTFLAMLATAPITQLFCFHVILMHKVKPVVLEVNVNYKFEVCNLGKTLFLPVCCFAFERTHMN